MTRPKPPRARRAGPVTRGVRADLAKMPEELRESGLAALAVELAMCLDDGRSSTTSKASCARELAHVLTELRGLAPVEPEADQLDDLTARRRARIA
jgi:hypothetical protein